MKNLKSISINGVLFTAIMSLFVATLFSFNPAAVMAVLTGASYLMPQGVVLMAVTKEIWKDDIINNLYKDNQFAQQSVNADAFVIQGKIVHIPIAGAAATIKKNLTVFPQTSIKRADTEQTYEIDTFYAVPHTIEKIEQYELSYDKRQSVIGEDQNALIQACMDSLLYRWAPLVANTILTAGASVPATLTGATGNRNSFTKAAFSTIKKSMDKQNIPANGRYCLLTADHYNDFLASLSDPERVDVGRVANLATGIVGMYLGITIYMRSTVLRYRGADGAYVVVDEQADGYAADVTDRAGSLFWHKDSVERARGEINMFDETNSPYYYGDVYSFNMRLGGRIRRTIGVWAVVEGIV